MCKPGNDTNCRYLSKDNQCLQCRDNHRLDLTYKCVKMCPSRQALDTVTQTCVACPSNCHDCSSPSICTTCLMQYSMIGGTCQNTVPFCVQGCETCLTKDPNECSKPMAGYYLDFNNSVRPYPIKCIIGNYFDYTLSQCKPCIANCRECSDATENNCPACSAGYFKYSTHCLLLPFPCDIYNGQWIDLSSNNTCKQCPNNCRACG